MRVFAVGDGVDWLVDTPAVVTCPTCVLAVTWRSSNRLCCVAYDAAGLTEHNSGQAEHADTTAWPILSSRSPPISSISFDPNEAKRLDGRS